jgi:hypothetical protein
MHREHESRAEPVPDATEVGWFAARQPGVVKFLEERLLHGDGDSFAVSLEAACRICAVIEQREGLPPPRVNRSLLERAEVAVLAEARHRGLAADGCAMRQPELCHWLAAYVADPPVPLTRAESAELAAVLASLIYALDELTSGRRIP